MRYLSILLVALLLWAVAGCGGGSSVVDNTDVGKSVTNYDDPVPDVYRNTDWCMVFDYGDPVEGENYVWASADVMYGSYGPEGEGWYMYFSMIPEYQEAGWLFCDAHVDYTDPGATGGKPGKFDWSWDSADDPPALPDVYLYIGSEMPDEYEIAIHCTLCWEGYIGEEWTRIEETGWGYNCSKMDEFPLDWGEDHSWKKWGGWTTNEAILPLFDSFPMGYLAKHYAAWPTYWEVILDDDSDLPFPGSNSFYGWCCDSHTRGLSQHSNVIVYSCYDANLPAYVQSPNWDVISYLANQRNNGAHPAATKFDWQRAFWYFKFAGVPENLDPISAQAQAIINDGIANGENYYPGPGEWYAVILYEPNQVLQINWMEVDP